MLVPAVMVVMSLVYALAAYLRGRAVRQRLRAQGYAAPLWTHGTAAIDRESWPRSESAPRLLFWIMLYRLRRGGFDVKRGAVNARHLDFAAGGRAGAVDDWLSQGEPDKGLGAAIDGHYQARIGCDAA